MSVAYDWVNSPDVSGEVAAIPGSNADGLVISPEAQADLANVLAPIVCRRARACIGESGTPGDHRYPLVSAVRETPKLRKRQREIIAEIVAQVGRISGGRIISSADLSRLGAAHRAPGELEVRSAHERASMVRRNLPHLRAHPTGDLPRALQGVLERGPPRR